MSAEATLGRAPGVWRAVTLNLWGENGPHEQRLELVAAELRRLGPDVVALQEVRDVPGRLRNQAESLAKGLGFHHVFAPATEWGGGTEGLAVVSRFAPRASAHRRLPHATDTEGRIVLSVELDAPTGPAWVHTTHLSYRENEGQKREDQVLVLDEEITARAAATQQPQMLMGDFNTVPEADEIRWLCGLTTLGGRRVFYQDAWATARPGELGITWARENPFRGRMNWLRADRRLDYVFVTAPRRDGRGSINGARLVFNQPDGDGIFPSDHYGVLADVVMVAPAPTEAPRGAAATTTTATTVTATGRKG